MLMPPRPDTPPHVRISPSYQNRSLDERREALQHDIVHKTEVSLDEFIETFLPRLPEGVEVDSTFMKHMHNIKAWRRFSRTPSHDPESENDIFRSLTPLLESMVKTAQTVWKAKCPPQRWCLLTEPEATPTTPEKPSTFQPDAFFHRKTSPAKTSDFSYYDIAFTAEFKKRTRNTHSVDNLSKVIFAMQHIMATDARRRFVFGITIENKSMRLWYANRSILVSSKSLDTKLDRRSLTWVLLSFAFAREVDMGWDTSIDLMQRDENQGGNFYIINVGGTKYQTLKVLQDHSADYLLSRAARIFSVKRVGDNEDNIYVLKDLWLEQDRKPEHEIYEEIVHDVEHLYPNNVDEFKQHLFTPFHHSFVKIGGDIDNTAENMMRNRTPVFSQVPLLVHTPSCKPETSSSMFPKPSDKEHGPFYGTNRHVRAPEEIRHRRHYRIVVKEFATPIHKVRKMGEVFVVLADMIKMFRFLHGSGWVHRDISAGNVYLCKGHGVLGDLEFAKKSDKHSEHELRTGTIDFMPVETIALRFLFRPITRPLTASKILLPFRYHALHDIESVWWVGVWMLFFFKPGFGGHEEPDDFLEQRQKASNAIFPGTLTHEARLSYLFTNEFVSSTQGWIASKFLDALEVFEDVRILLLKHYQDLEKLSPLAIKCCHHKLTLDLVHSPVVHRRIYMNLSGLHFRML